MRAPAPATVISIVALVVALGGTSYAALKIGSADVRNNSLKSVDIRNGSLRARDFRAGDLPIGPVGPAGPAGPAGPPGAAATQLWATVAANGTLGRNRNATSATRSSTGVYTVVFNQAVRDCAYFGTIGVHSIDNPAGFISLAQSETDANTVVVHTDTEGGGDVANLPFAVSVLC
jgi:hypothetical protein